MHSPRRYPAQFLVAVCVALAYAGVSSAQTKKGAKKNVLDADIAVETSFVGKPAKLTATKSFAIAAPLIIEGGSVVQVAPGVTISLSAPIKVAGDTDKRVKFIAQNQRQPWRGFVVKTGFRGAIEDLEISGADVGLDAEEQCEVHLKRCVISGNGIGAKILRSDAISSDGKRLEFGGVFEDCVIAAIGKAASSTILEACLRRSPRSSATASSPSKCSRVGD
jgi:hypothetical protein